MTTVRSAVRWLLAAWLSARELWLETRLEAGAQLIAGREADLKEDYAKRDRLTARLRAVRVRLALVERPRRLIRQGRIT